MGNEVYIPREKVESVVSIARHLQAMNSKGQLEQTVSDFLPATDSEQTEEISEQDMYQLGEILGVDSKYVQRAMQLYSGSMEGTMETLDKMGIEPSKGLKFKWFNQFAKHYGELLLNFLNQETDPSYPFEIINPFERYYDHGLIIYAKEYTKKEFFRSRQLKEKRVSGEFWLKNDFKQNSIAVNVNLHAFTPRFLAPCSGPLRDLTLQIPYIISCNVIFDPKRKHDILPGWPRSFLVDDPY